MHRRIPQQMPLLQPQPQPQPQPQLPPPLTQVYQTPPTPNQTPQTVSMHFKNSDVYENKKTIEQTKYLFLEACKNGDIDHVKSIISIPTLIEHVDLYTGFNHANKSSHMDIMNELRYYVDEDYTKLFKNHNGQRQQGMSDSIGVAIRTSKDQKEISEKIPEEVLESFMGDLKIKKKKILKLSKLEKDYLVEYHGSIDKYIGYISSLDKKSLNDEFENECENLHIGIVDYLLNKISDVNYKDIFSYTCNSIKGLYSKELASNQIEILKMLIKRSRQTIDNEFWHRGFENACYHSNLNVIKFISDSFELTSVDYDYGLVCVSNMFTYSKDEHFNNKIQMECIHYFESKHNDSGIKCDWTRCLKAMTYGNNYSRCNLNVVEYLIEKGADSTILKDNKTLMSRLNKHRSYKIQKDIEYEQYYTQEPEIAMDFKEMCEEGNIQEIKKIIEKEKDKFKFQYGLSCACESGNTEVFELIIKNCTKYNVIPGLNNALRRACDHGHLELVKLIIEKSRAKKSFLNFNSALLGACDSGNLELVKLMLSCGADNLNDGLSRACTGGHLEIYEFIENECRIE